MFKKKQFKFTLFLNFGNINLKDEILQKIVENQKVNIKGYIQCRCLLIKSNVYLSKPCQMDSIYNFVYNETQKVAQVNMIIKLYKHIVTVFVCKTG